MMRSTLISFGRLAPVVLFLFAGLATNADAAIIYGDFDDIPPGVLNYRNVEESSFTNTVPPGLYGPPTVSVNTLDFNPTAFGTTSSNGASSVVDGQISFTIEALPGAGLTSFSIVERGDFSFSGIPPTPGTFLGASAGATVTILAVDGVDLAVPIPVFASGLFLTDYPTTGGAPLTGLLPWNLVTLVDLGPSLPPGFVSGASKIDVSINNQLTTGTTTGNTATIAKKDFTIIPVGDLTPNDVVPEPGALSLAALGCVALLAARRRRG